MRPERQWWLVDDEAEPALWELATWDMPGIAKQSEAITQLHFATQLERWL